jgi:valyl-tRNA synthetase
MRELQELVGVVRNLRADYGIDPGRRVELVLASLSPGMERAIAEEEDGIVALARLSDLSTSTAIPRGVAGAHAILQSGVEVFVPLAGVVDLEKERERITAELERLDGLLRATVGKLGNAGFIKGAPPEVVEREREKAASFEQRRDRLLEKRDAFLMPDA